MEVEALPHPALAPYRALAELERLQERELAYFEQEEARLSGERADLSERNRELVERQSKSVEAQRSWSLLTTVSQYLLSTSSIILGLSCLAVAQVGAACLIGAGAA